MVLLIKLKYLYKKSINITIYSKEFKYEQNIKGR